MVWDVLQDYAENTQETTLNEAYARMVKHGYNMTPFQTFSNAKAQHQVEELVEMIKMDTWIAQFGVRMEKLCLHEDHRHSPVRPVGLT